MRRRDDLAKLDGIVRLRAVQLRDTEMKAARAIARTGEQRTLEQSALDAFTASHDGWQAAAAAPSHDPDSSARWAAACQGHEAAHAGRQHETDRAEADERTSRESWRVATARHDNAVEIMSDARSAQQRAREEQADHRTAERYGRGVGRGR